jgi:hypothetical protein
MTPSHLAGLLGFLFVAAWIALGFGDAILCLLGAGAFYLAAALYRGEVDLEAVQPRRQPRPGRATRT